MNLKGEAEGRGRAKAAAHSALHNPLLEDISIKGNDSIGRYHYIYIICDLGAKGVLINVYGGSDLTLHEVFSLFSYFLYHRNTQSIVFIICSIF